MWREKGEDLLQLIGAKERHGVDPDVVAHNELHPHKPDAVVGDELEAVSLLRVGQVHHNLRVHTLDIAHVRFNHLSFPAHAPPHTHIEI